MTIIRKIIHKDDIPLLSAEQKDRLETLKDRPIDLSDVPEELDWSHAVRGKFTKKRLPVDDDVFEWLEKDGKPAEVRLNELLHKLMEDEGQGEHFRTLVKTLNKKSKSLKSMALALEFFKPQKYAVHGAMFF